MAMCGGTMADDDKERWLMMKAVSDCASLCWGFDHGTQPLVRSRRSHTHKKPKSIRNFNQSGVC